MPKQRQHRPTRKKKQPTPSKSIFIIALIALIPICFGIYLYCQQTLPIHANPHHRQEHQSSPATTYKQLHIPLSPTTQESQIITHTGYTVSYNSTLKIPNWVSYELTRQETQGNEKRQDRFVADPAAEGPTATNADYTRSGYDKGHMAPAADMKWSHNAMKESFYFSNICPQHPQLNRRGWKNLEEKIRDWAAADSALIIICGPIVEKGAQTIGTNKVTVPQRFFKVILSPFATPMRAIGFLFDNQRALDPLPTYVVTVDSIEKLTGIDFFAPLPDDIENTIEKEADIRQWPH